MMVYRRGDTGLIDKKLVDVSAPNLISICVDDDPEGRQRIRFYSRYARDAVILTDMNQLLIESEQLMDRIGYPQTSTRGRSFSGTQQSTAKKGAERVRTADEILNEVGKKSTFVVKVQYRQNATWQGKVLWAETGKSCNFRSALELLKLIDGALDEAEEGVPEKKE